MLNDPMTIYYEKWLPRARRLLAPSGRLTELAMVLSSRDEVSVDEWQGRLRRVLDGKEAPDTDLVFEVERFVARPKVEESGEETPELGLAS
ncbi:MAG: hypothetical protein AAGC74_01885 [Verrucomicrobiota bacterium]